MTVDKLGENKVLIILCNKDMEDYSIDFVGNNLYDSDLRKALINIMKLGCSKAGVEICNRNVDIFCYCVNYGTKQFWSSIFKCILRPLNI